MTLRAFRNYDPVAPLHSSITLKQKVALQVFRISGTLHKNFFLQPRKWPACPCVLGVLFIWPYLVCYLPDPRINFLVSFYVTPKLCLYLDVSLVWPQYILGMVYLSDPWTLFGSSCVKVMRGKNADYNTSYSRVEWVASHARGGLPINPLITPLTKVWEVNSKRSWKQSVTVDRLKLSLIIKRLQDFSKIAKKSKHKIKKTHKRYWR